jgi:hypothetical protein
MKKILLSASILMMLSANGQVNDQVSVAASYANQSYYNLENGEVSNITNLDWDLAFDASAFGSAIRINGANAVELFVTPYSIADWSTIDTMGMTSWTQNFDSDLSWSSGAFNADYDLSNPSDLGWGEYNSITHFVIGTKTFVIKMNDGSVKKVLIDQLGSGDYTFKHSDLDNSNEITEVITKSDYTGKNFVYYNITTTTVIDREPLSEDWDIVFGKYITEIYPGATYGVTGALMNQGTTVYKDESVETNTAVINNNFVYSDAINTIGYNWKSFDFSTYTYILDDSATYFIQTAIGDVWKVGFTAFGGSSNGDIEFTKEKMASAGVYTNSELTITTYPNPVTNSFNIKSDLNGEATVSLQSMNGKQTINETVDFINEPIEYNVDNYNSGIYILTVTYKNGQTLTEKIIITK